MGKKNEKNNSLYLTIATQLSGKSKERSNKTNNGILNDPLIVSAISNGEDDFRLVLKLFIKS